METKNKENKLLNIVVKVGGDYTVSLKEQFGDEIDSFKIRRFVNETRDKYLNKYQNITIQPDDWNAHLKKDTFSIFVQHLVHFEQIKSSDVEKEINKYLKNNFTELKNRKYDWMTKPNFVYGAVHNSPKK